ncbi:DNA topoisomerase [Weissella ceti]|uniref:DNA topoisomerase n=1 Tax=Weissella ceti TaxID=759620 RepID=A0ABT3E3W5_9LACO|nr:DNA topoisomerase [Weissella ceti]MCW0953121.1 DNA topoisomerase [Weissella ceti]QVK12640.1 type IA DNA topoisomerase [Weissella ceti]
MKYLIITEKPSARKNFEKALGGKQGHYLDFDYELTSLRGHVMQLHGPEKQVPKALEEQLASWRLEYLPWDLSQFAWKNTYIKSKNLRTGKIESTKKLLDELKLQAKQVDALVIATDNDPSGEGELLAWEAIQAIGWRGQVLRADFMDESAKSIQKAFHALRDVSDPTQDGDLLMGMARSRWDFASMQLTRIATKGAEQQGYKLLSRQGRLKSAMIYKVYEQEEAIKNYQRVPFYEARYKDNKGNVYTRSTKGLDVIPFRFPNKRAAETDMTSGPYPLVGTPQIVADQEKRQAPPKLLDLSSLSAVLAKEGFKAKDVLATYQKMYEAQIVSYPRTEDRTITTEQFMDLLPMVDQIAGVVGVPTTLLTHRTARKTHIKDEGAHGANRPGEKVPTSLDALQKFGASAARIYQVLAKNFLAMFAEDYVYRQIKANIQEAPMFTSVLNMPVHMNWKLVYQDGDAEKEDQTSDGIGNTANMFVHEGQNPKPQQPTWQWLKTFLEKYDIGTGATRTSTFSDLSSGKNAYFIDTKGKIKLTNEGAISAYLVKGTFIANPSITKRIFDIFKEVGRQETSMAYAQNSIELTIKNDMPVILKNAESLADHFAKPTKRTKKHVPKEKITGMYTPTGKEVSFNAKWGKHTFTANEINDLLSGKEIDIQGKGTKREYTYRGKLTDYTYKGKKTFGFNGDFV